MIQKIFAVRDRATDSFGAPMFFMAHGQAIRTFSDEVNRQDKDNQLYAHPDDFDLYYLGDYETTTATFTTITPEQVIVGKSAAIR